MGTDIFLRVEKFDGETWREVEPPYESAVDPETRIWSPLCSIAYGRVEFPDIFFRNNRRVEESDEEASGEVEPPYESAVDPETRCRSPMYSEEHAASMDKAGASNPFNLRVDESDREASREVEPPGELDWGALTPHWSPLHSLNYVDRMGETEGPNPDLRDYFAFAFLADVRNGTGVFGHPRHTPVKPQFANRGLPPACEYEANENCHGLTWATLTELLFAPWDMVFESVGIVDKENYIAWKENGVPIVSFAGVEGGSVTIHDIDFFEEHLDHMGKGDYTRVSWSWQPLLNCDFRRWVIYVLSQYTDDPDHLRVIMEFG